MTRLLVVLVALPLALAAVSCGDDSDNGGGGVLPTDDVRVAQIAGVAELATNAFASAGPQGLYDYMGAPVTQQCTVQQLSAALFDQELPSGFAGVKEVSFQGDGAHATLRQKFGDQEREAEWVFTPAPGNTWRIVNMPGLEECRAQ